MDLLAVDPTGKPKRLFREKTGAWVEDQGEPVFLKDGSFLFPSERDGYKHLYLYAPDGTLKRQVTSGPWEMQNLHSVDEEHGWVYFSATLDNPIGQNLYRVSLTTDGKPERLTDGVGNHSVSCNKSCSMYIDTVSSFSKPSTVTLRKNDGSAVRRLDTNPVYAIEEYKLGKQELVKIPMRDGFVLEGSLVLPVDFDPNRHYPVWFTTYGGPHAPPSRIPGASIPSIRFLPAWASSSSTATRTAPAARGRFPPGPPINSSGCRNSRTSRRPWTG